MKNRSLIRFLLLGGLLIISCKAVSITTSTPLPTEIIDTKGVTMRLVPAGKFSMGSENYNREKPIHIVDLDAFYIDKYEVTNAAYKACVDEGECDPPKHTSSYTHDSYYGNSQFDDSPVIYVDWNQANAYCEWRGASLPTEAQWEKAARGDDGRTYPWGNTFNGTNVNFCDTNCSIDDADKNVDDGYADTAPVGSYESGKSPYGIYDMAGNVWEWVADWFDAYPGNTVSNDFYGTKYRVLRGGSWARSDDLVRSALRVWDSPVINFNDIGFRCARSLP